MEVPDVLLHFAFLEVAAIVAALVVSFWSGERDTAGGTSGKRWRHSRGCRSDLHLQEAVRKLEKRFVRYQEEDDYQQKLAIFSDEVPCLSEVPSVVAVDLLVFLEDLAGCIVFPIGPIGHASYILRRVYEIARGYRRDGRIFSYCV